MLTKEELLIILQDLHACEASITRFEDSKLSPRECFDEICLSDLWWLLGGPLGVEERHYQGTCGYRKNPRAFTYEDVEEIIYSEWLVKTQCPDYWEGLRETNDLYPW